MQDKEEEPKVHLHNHLRFNILVNLNKVTQMARIVGFEVEPFSVRHRYEGEWPAEGPAPPLLTCNPQRMAFVMHDAEPQVVETGEEVIFTYDTMFSVRRPMWLFLKLELIVRSGVCPFYLATFSVVRSKDPCSECAAPRSRAVIGISLELFHLDAEN